MKPAPALLLLALAAALMLPASPAYAQIELTEADPPDGTRLDAPPDVVHLCFSQPVNIEDSTTFDFNYLMPEEGGTPAPSPSPAPDETPAPVTPSPGLSLGLRIVFQPDGECVNVFPGLPTVRPAGEYTFEWQVTAAEADEEGSGTLYFQVTQSSSATPEPSPTPGETPPPVTPSPEGGPGAGDAGDDDGPDILFLALITTAGVGVAAVLFTLGYLLRRRIGYEPHRPPEGGEEGEGH